MGKFKEMEIEAQDAVIADYDTMYEIMPEREPTDADLKGMQIQECLLHVEGLETHMNEMLFRAKYYKEGFSAEDFDIIIAKLKDLKRTLE